jgi:hypothetical protein
METNWIPREKRWTNEERKQRETEARNARAMSRMFWLELNKMRLKIEKEIENEKLARIKLLE